MARMLSIKLWAFIAQTVLVNEITILKQPNNIRHFCLTNIYPINNFPTDFTQPLILPTQF